MEAAEAKIQKVLEGSKQFIVPHYQRPYSWREEQWKTLWRDIEELLEDSEAKPHFLGSIVTSPGRSVPEGVEKRLLIDGQQRLTTLLVLLVLVRDRARAQGNTRLADRVQDFVTNRHEEGSEHYKLLPTAAEDPAESDRHMFLRLVEGHGPDDHGSKSGVLAAYDYFAGRLRRQDAPDLELLLKVVVGRLTLVSIILDEKDNPHRIFESLNGKGRPLSQADLIRNYFFMRLPEKEHEKVYTGLWRPMQRRLGEDALTDFVRHYLSRSGSLVRETDVYAALKARIEGSTDKPLDHLRELARFSEYYKVLLEPGQAPSARVRERLARLNRLEVTVAYPFLLGVLADHADHLRREEEVCGVLDALENFLIRRFVCGIPTYGLNRSLASLYEQVRGAPDLVAAVHKVLGASTRNYPRDEEFRDRLVQARLYGGGDRQRRTKLILERLEAALGHKESVPGELLTIEHVLPQTLGDDWKACLGETWEEDHEQYLHTLGNLTLTSYNSELSNGSFAEKKKLFAQSHVELNRYFGDLEQWTRDEIEQRAEVLADLAIDTWPYFGPPLNPAEDSRITGTVPSLVRFKGSEIPVESWRDVAVVTMEGILELGEEEFAQVCRELPKFVNRDATAFRRSGRLRKLSNGAYLELNRSAASFYRGCVQAVQLVGLGPEDWSVVYSGEAAPSEGQDISSSQQLQLEFWTRLRSALLATGKFTSLQNARPRNWFEVALGRSGIYISLTANTQESFVRAQIMLVPDKAAALAPLEEQREEIEQELGWSLEWNPNPQKGTKVIRTSRPCGILDRESWPAAMEWLVATTVALHRVFAPRVQLLDLSPGQPPAASL